MLETCLDATLDSKTKLSKIEQTNVLYRTNLMCDGRERDGLLPYPGEGQSLAKFFPLSEAVQ
jgi:hypothetical protein